MNYAIQVNEINDSKTDIIVLKQQLSREIVCLQGQLSRLTNRDDLIGRSTIETYQEMIETRKEALRSL